MFLIKKIYYFILRLFKLEKLLFYDNFKINQHRDELKVEYCKINKIKLCIITYKDDIDEKMREIIKN